MTNSPESRERRSQTVVGKILRAERMIELEIRNNGGIYPRSDGVLTEAEVCLRAGVTPNTLHAAAHATTTRLQLMAWLRKMSAWMEHAKKHPDGDGDGRSNEWKADVGNRTGEWKALLEQIAISYDTANVEVATLRKRVKALKEREDALAEKHANLNATLSRGKAGRKPR